MTKTKAIIYDGVDQIRFGDVTLPALGPKQILATTLYTFVSPGTELRVLGGHYGAEGNYPVVPGYAAISRILEPGAEDRVARLGNGGYDIVVEASGSIPGVELAYRMIRRKPQNYSTDYKAVPVRRRELSTGEAAPP